MDISGVRLRGLRAGLFSALVVLLSAGSHVLMSRVPLPPAPVVGAFAAVFGLAYALAGRERGFGSIAGLLVPLELAADTVFTSGQHVCYGPAGGPVAGPLRALGLDALCGGTPVGGALTGVTGPAADPAALLASPGPWAPWLLLGAHVSVASRSDRCRWPRPGRRGPSGRSRDRRGRPSPAWGPSPGSPRTPWDGGGLPYRARSRAPDTGTAVHPFPCHTPRRSR